MHQHDSACADLCCCELVQPGDELVQIGDERHQVESVSVCYWACK